jgi:RimJ/RimL family protein N-acetyltransferase
MTEPSDLTAGEMPRPITLEGQHVTLVPLDPARDAAALYAAAHDGDADRLFRYLTSGPFAGVAEYRANIEAWHARPDVLAFALVDPATGAPFGSASYMRIAPADRCLEIGSIWYAPAQQRSTAPTEAMFLLARHAFDGLGYRRYEWKCDARNLPSRRAALRLGFAYEGLFRQHMIVKGRNRDTAWYAMTDADWPAHRAGFERWLELGNFDAEGRQRRTLEACRAEG